MGNELFIQSFIMDMRMYKNVEWHSWKRRKFITHENNMLRKRRKRQGRRIKRNSQKRERKIESCGPLVLCTWMVQIRFQFRPNEYSFPRDCTLNSTKKPFYNSFTNRYWYKCRRFQLLLRKTRGKQEQGNRTFLIFQTWYLTVVDNTRTQWFLESELTQLLL